MIRRTRRRPLVRRAAGLLLALAVAGAAGCSGPPAEAAPARADQPACLPAAEVVEVLEVPIDRVLPKSGGCLFTFAGSEAFLTAWIQQDPDPALLDRYERGLPDADQRAQPGPDQQALLGQVGRTERIEGLGDRAYYAQELVYRRDASAPGVVVLVGSSMLQVMLTPTVGQLDPGVPGDARGKLIELARRILDGS